MSLTGFLSYSRVNWQQSPSKSTPLSAANLNIMDAGIKNNNDMISNIRDEVTQLNSNLGTIRKGAWISTTGGNSEKCTETIYLNKGIYIINYHSALSSDKIIFMALNVDGFNLDYSHTSGNTYARGTVYIEITKDNTPIYVADTGGAIKTYSYLERGGIEAIKFKQIGV